MGFQLPTSTGERRIFSVNSIYKGCTKSVSMVHIAFQVEAYMHKSQSNGWTIQDICVPTQEIGFSHISHIWHSIIYRFKMVQSFCFCRHLFPLWPRGPSPWAFLPLLPLQTPVLCCKANTWDGIATLWFVQLGFLGILQRQQSWHTLRWLGRWTYFSQPTPFCMQTGILHRLVWTMYHFIQLYI